MYCTLSLLALPVFFVLVRVGEDPVTGKPGGKTAAVATIDGQLRLILDIVLQLD